MVIMPHERFMKAALEEAVKGCGWTNPNPMVGAVIVKDGEIIGRGYHQKYGGPHAERNALASCSQDPAGSTMYVTLEPCCHHGKTPPCTDAVIESGIRTVVIGSKDPNVLVAGKGIEILERHGIEVICGLPSDECRELNEVFFHYIGTGTPYVVMKYAMTLDGKIATATGRSKWITGEAAREHVHRSRHRYAGIMVGVGTVLADDPLLTCRMPDGKNPVRIICDTDLRIPVDSEIVRTAGEVETLIASAVCGGKKARLLQDHGITIIQVSKKNGHIDLHELMRILGQRKLDSVLLEGGATLNAAALESGIVNKIQTYIAPRIFGGADARSPVGGVGADDPAGAWQLTDRKMTVLGEDILLEYNVAAPSVCEERERSCLQE
jgi:diaminohydroxyphosphoribosylaminopyrimidine deaminase / 5-amino-6-(5-phosphoribosylamino)uracil reductase